MRIVTQKCHCGEIFTFDIECTLLEKERIKTEKPGMHRYGRYCSYCGRKWIFQALMDKEDMRAFEHQLNVTMFMRVSTEFQGYNEKWKDE